MTGAIYPQHTEGDTVMRWAKAQRSALARHAAVCTTLLSMLGQPNFEITRLIAGFFYSVEQKCGLEPEMRLF